MTRATHLFILVLCLAWGSAVFAHQDPAGDIYPRVMVVNGMFHVVFHSYGEEGRSNLTYRIIYAPDGKVVVPRHRVTDPDLLKSWGDSLGRYPAKWLAIPRIDWVSDKIKHDSGTRSRLVLKDEVDGQLKVEPLPFDASKMADLTEYWISDSHAALLWSSTDENAANGQGAPLHLTWFQRGAFSHAATKDLGPCATIYSMSVASNLVWAGGRLWVAWVEVRAANGAQRPWQTQLTSFDPISGKTETQPLQGPSHWNVHLSLGTTGGWLCAAWHCSVDGTYPGKSQIVTVFQKLPALPEKPAGQ